MLRSTLIAQQRRRLPSRRSRVLVSSGTTGHHDADKPSEKHFLHRSRPPASATATGRSYSTLSCATLCRPTHHTLSPSSSHHQCQKQVRHKSVFVSKHNQSLNVTAQDIIDHCEHSGVASHSGDYRQTASHVILKECPFCTKPTNDRPDNQFKLYIATGSGAYFCHRCGKGGSWFDWKLRLSPGNQLGEVVDPTGHDYSAAKPSAGGMQMRASSSSSRSYPTPQSSAPTSTSNKNKSTPLPLPATKLQTMYIEQLKGSDVETYLKSKRGLEGRTLTKYGVGRALYKFPDKKGQWVNGECATFPWIMSVSDIEYQEELRGAKFEWDPEEKPDGGEGGDDDEDDNDDRNDTATVPTASDKPVPTLQEIKDSTFLIRRIKARCVDQKAWQRMDPPGGGWGLFGYHTVPADSKEIVLTEGEYDAMAVWQATGRPAVSLPNGCRSLPVEVLPLLEKFDKVYLWMDNDAAGQEGAEKFAKKIGLERTYLVRPTQQNCERLVKTEEGKEEEAADSEESVAGMEENVAVEKVELPKDANDALRAGLDMEAIIADAKLTPHERITTFADLRHEVLHEIMHPDKYVGTAISSLPGLTNIIKGLRRGELTVSLLVSCVF